MEEESWWDFFYNIFMPKDYVIDIKNNKQYKTNIKDNSWVPIMKMTTQCMAKMKRHLKDNPRGYGLTSFSGIKKHMKNLMAHEKTAVQFDFIACIRSSRLTSEVRSLLIETGRKVLLGYSFTARSVLTKEDINETKEVGAPYTVAVPLWEQANFGEVFYRALLWWDIIIYSSCHRDCNAYLENNVPNPYYNPAGLTLFATYYVFFACCILSLKLDCDLAITNKEYYGVWVQLMNMACFVEDRESASTKTKSSDESGFLISDFKVYERFVLCHEPLFSAFNVTSVAHYFYIYYCCAGWDDISVDQTRTRVIKSWALLYTAQRSYAFISYSQSLLAYSILLFVILMIDTKTSEFMDETTQMKNEDLMVLENLFQRSRTEVPVQTALQELTHLYELHYENIVQLCKRHEDEIYKREHVVLF